MRGEILSTSFMKINEFTKAEFVCENLKPTSKIELLESMVNQLCKFHPEINKEKLIENLLIREKENSTGIGNQIAIPHTTDKNIKKTVCLIGQIPMGLEFDSLDNKKVLLAFLLVSPPGLMNEHIRLLSRVAKIVKDPKLVETLSKASKDDLLKLIIAEDEKIS